MPYTRDFIEVTNPKPLGQNNPINAQCSLNASGTIDQNQAQQVKKVWVRLNHTWEFVDTSGSFTWHVNNVGPCNLAAQNVLEVKADYIDMFGVPQSTDYGDKCVAFTCSGTTSSCYYYAWGPYSCSRAGFLANGLLTTVLPRFYKLSLQAVDEDAFAGLVQRSSLYLIYDAERSSADEAVWRADVLPAVAGSWTLRVRPAGASYEGQLVYQRVEQRRVPPPQVFESRMWNVNGVNKLVLSHACCKKEAGVLAAAVLSVEPA